jgi:hypothetical protein
MRHFQRGMASVPEWAPPHEPHLLRSSSIVREIHYGARNIEYTTFDEASCELLKLPVMPSEIRTGRKKLPLIDKVNAGSEDGYSVKEVAGGGFAVRVKHNHSLRIRIAFE